MNERHGGDGWDGLVHLEGKFKFAGEDKCNKIVDDFYAPLFLASASRTPRWFVEGTLPGHLSYIYTRQLPGAFSSSDLLLPGDWAQEGGRNLFYTLITFYVF